MCPACSGRRILHESHCEAPSFFHIPKRKNKKCCNFIKCGMCFGEGKMRDETFKSIYRNLTQHIEE